MQNESTHTMVAMEKRLFVVLPLETFVLLLLDIKQQHQQYDIVANFQLKTPSSKAYSNPNYQREKYQNTF